MKTKLTIPLGFICICLLFVCIHVQWSGLQDFSFLPVGQCPGLGFQLRNSVNISSTWVVVTASDLHLRAALDNTPGLRMLIVGDEDVPNVISKSHTYLKSRQFPELSFKREYLTHEKSYQLAIGYLYVISKGTKSVFVSGDVDAVVDTLHSFTFSRSTRGLLFHGETLFNPFHHFGHPHIWPVGSPVQPATFDKVNLNYRLGHWKTPAVQQAIVNGMDGEFLHNTDQSMATKLTFDEFSPSVSVSTGIFSLFRPENCLFQYDALWALFVPSLNTFSSCSICRGLIIQRLLWEMGGNLGFTYSNKITLIDNPTKNAAVTGAFNIPTFIQFLSSWRCDSEGTFFDCVIQLSNDLFTEKLLVMKDLNFTIAWINDLRSIGYTEPSRISLGSLRYRSNFFEETELLKQSKLSFFNSAVNIIFWPSEQTSTYRNITRKQTLASHITTVAAACKSIHQNTSFTDSINLRTYPNILLIVVFNFPHYQNIPFLETMYHSNFPHMLYCGAKKKKFDEQTKNMKPVTFIELDIGNGWFAQNCLIKAMLMFPNLDGYLYIGDDVLLNTWNIKNLPLNKIWFGEAALLRQTVKTTNWQWVNMDNVGLSRYQAAINASKSLNRKRFSKFFNLLAQNTKFPDGFYHGGSDIVYIPRTHREDAVYFLDHFSKFNLFVEMTIPTVIAGIEKWENVFHLPGMYLWYDGKREHIEKYFNKDDVFMHPVKIPKELKTLKGRRFYCETYFPLTYTG